MNDDEDYDYEGYVSYRVRLTEAQHSDFEIVAHKHEQAQDPNFHF